ncbi:hypothetical protein ATANTOWER_006816 [Ataeniobius toweri]|uniref:Uncharacterized protein n=1 Tax=Ataeniobius toweri TaxID=208326 RepID=A0ABU7AML8_9TELE|nr:hypothetical protein [Ataeniobius toweri]
MNSRPITVMHLELQFSFKQNKQLQCLTTIGHPSFIGPADCSRVRRCCNKCSTNTQLHIPPPSLLSPGLLASCMQSNSTEGVGESLFRSGEKTGSSCESSGLNRGGWTWSLKHM